MFGIFGRKKEERNLIELEPDGPVDCIADFTYNFYWQHHGEKLDPDQLIPGTEYSYRDVVEHVRSGGGGGGKGGVGHPVGPSQGGGPK